MSLFIGTLAYDDPAILAQVRLSILVASAMAVVWGYAVLKYASKKYGNN